MLRQTLIAVALAASLVPEAHADHDPFWSLAIGVPGLVAHLGNVVPVVPQPVYVAPPPVQYVPAPPVYIAQPYAPTPQYYTYRTRPWRGGEHRRWEHGDDEGDR